MLVQTAGKHVIVLEGINDIGDADRWGVLLRTENRGQDEPKAGS